MSEKDNPSVFLIAKDIRENKPYLSPLDPITRDEKISLLLNNEGAFLYQRDDGSIGVDWPTFEDDLIAFEEVVKLILEHAELDNVRDDYEFRILILPNLMDILRNKSPIFQALANSFGSRPESTSDHSEYVVGMLDTRGLAKDFDVILARIQAVFHDIGKFFLSSGCTEGKRNLAKDPGHLHAYLSALMLEELVRSMDGDLRSDLNLCNTRNIKKLISPIMFHHGLEAVAEESIPLDNLLVLMRETPASMAHSFILMMADMGAAGKTRYLVENMRVLFDLIGKLSAKELKQLGGLSNIESIIGNSLARIIYEMGQEKWLSLSSTDEEQVIKKINSIIKNLNEIISSLDQDNNQNNLIYLSKVIEKSLIELYKSVILILDKNNHLADVFKNLFNPFLKKYSNSIISLMME